MTDEYLRSIHAVREYAKTLNYVILNLLQYLMISLNQQGHPDAWFRQRMDWICGEYTVSIGISIDCDVAANDWSAKQRNNKSILNIIFPLLKKQLKNLIYS